MALIPIDLIVWLHSMHTVIDKFGHSHHINHTFHALAIASSVVLDCQSVANWPAVSRYIHTVADCQYDTTTYKHGFVDDNLAIILYICIYICHYKTVHMVTGMYKDT